MAVKTHVQKFIMFTCISLLAGCASVAGDFEKAQRADSISAYRSFISKHQNSEYEEQARKRIEELEAEQEAAKKRREEAERNAWEIAKAGDSIERLAEFTTAYPASEHVGEARDAMREIIQKTAVSHAGGDRENIKAGKDFPLHLFDPNDIIKGFGEIEVGFYVRAQSGEVVQQNMGWQAFDGFAKWQRFYDMTLANVGNSDSAYTGFDIRMAEISAIADSSLRPGTRVTFYRDPEFKTKTTLRLSIDRKFSQGAISEDEVAIEGVGIAILSDGSATEVYEFTKEGISLLR